jgi:hypothetical protein
VLVCGTAPPALASSGLCRGDWLWGIPGAPGRAGRSATGARKKPLGRDHPGDGFPSLRAGVLEFLMTCHPPTGHSTPSSGGFVFADFGVTSAPWCDTLVGLDLLCDLRVNQSGR